MSKRITQDQADMAMWLLQEQRLTHRQVAAQMGVSLSTIYRILHGKWQPACAGTEDSLELYVHQPARRCPQCGAQVTIWPCLACQISDASPENAITSPDK